MEDIYIDSVRNIINMLENESLLTKSEINEVKKKVEKIKSKLKKRLVLDGYFVTMDLVGEIVSIMVYEGTDKTGKLVDSFKTKPDKIMRTIKQYLSGTHINYLENEIERIKKYIEYGGKYVQR